MSRPKLAKKSKERKLLQGHRAEELLVKRLAPQRGCAARQNVQEERGRQGADLNSSFQVHLDRQRRSRGRVRRTLYHLPEPH